MHYDPFRIITEEIHRLQTLNKRQLRIHRMAAEQLKQQILEELSVEDVVELVYKKCPSYGEITAFITLLRQASLNALSLDDIKSAKAKSEIFKNVTDSNLADGSTITARLKSVIDDFNDIFKLAIHEQSEDGADISDKEYEMLNDTLIIMGFLVSDQATMLDSKYKHSKRRKALVDKYVQKTV